LIFFPSRRKTMTAMQPRATKPTTAPEETLVLVVAAFTVPPAVRPPGREEEEEAEGEAAVMRPGREGWLDWDCALATALLGEEGRRETEPVACAGAMPGREEDDEIVDLSDVLFGIAEEGDEATGAEDAAARFGGVYMDVTMRAVVPGVGFDSGETDVTVEGADSERPCDR
jgi:hypothetical protein